MKAIFALLGFSFISGAVSIHAIDGEEPLNVYNDTHFEIHHTTYLPGDSVRLDGKQRKTFEVLEDNWKETHHIRIIRSMRDDFNDRYTVSVYLKANGRKNVRLAAMRRKIGAGSQFAQPSSVIIDLEHVYTEPGSSDHLLNSSVKRVKDGWVHCKFAFRLRPSNVEDEEMLIFISLLDENKDKRYKGESNSGIFMSEVELYEDDLTD